MLQIYYTTLCQMMNTLNILRNDKIKRCESIKFLGVFLHQNLTWEDHIKYAENKIAKI